MYINLQEQTFSKELHDNTNLVNMQELADPGH